MKEVPYSLVYLTKELNNYLLSFYKEGYTHYMRADDLLRMELMQKKND